MEIKVNLVTYVLATFTAPFLIVMCLLLFVLTLRQWIHHLLKSPVRDWSSTLVYTLSWLGLTLFTFLVMLIVTSPLSLG